MYSSIITADDQEVPIFDGKSIPNNKLDFRFKHKVDPERGTWLSDGEVTFRQQNLVAVDPLGLGGSINIGDVVSAGDTSIRGIRNAQS